MSSSLTVDGTDLSGASYGLQVMEHVHPLGGARRWNRQALSGADGEAVESHSRESVNLGFLCAITADSQAAFETKLGNLRSFFDARVGPYYLIWSARSSERWTVIQVGQIDVALALSGGIFRLDFVDTLGGFESV